MCNRSAEGVIACHLQGEVTAQGRRPAAILGLCHFYPRLLPLANYTPQPQCPGPLAFASSTQSRWCERLWGPPAQQCTQTQTQVSHHQPALAVPHQPVQAAPFRLLPQPRPHLPAALPQPHPHCDSLTHAGPTCPLSAHNPHSNRLRASGMCQVWVRCCQWIGRRLPLAHLPIRRRPSAASITTCAGQVIQPA